MKKVMMEYPIYDSSDKTYFAGKNGDNQTIEFAEFIEQLLEREEWENSVEKGIISLVNIEGTKYLSEKQSYILGIIVARHERDCIVSGEKIPMNEVLDSGGISSYYQNQI